MLTKISKIAFFLSIVCFFLSILSMSVKFYEAENFWLHQYFIILILTVIAFGLNLFGFGGVRNKLDYVRNIFTLIISSVLILFISYVLFIGALFS